MTNFIQLHALTIYPPSNLNRDDSGRPKTARFGGVERLRISSQALKRAIRTSDTFKARVGNDRGERTQRLGEEIRKHLVARSIDPAKATAIAREIAGLFGKIKDEKAVDKEGRDISTYIEQLAFVSNEERAAALDWAEKLAAGDKLPDKVDDRVAALLRQTDRATDVAMFGRMLADNPDYNREAAVQVAHAITTHRVDVEDDFYTAVDDLKRSTEDAGAGFIGELGFGSGVFYLYACIDRDLLDRNLGGDKALSAKAIAAFVDGLATTSPTGKQASFASRARASYLRIEKGTQQPRTLAAAFLKSIRGDDLLQLSINELEALATSMNDAYGRCYAGDPYVMNVAAKAGNLESAIAFAVTE